MKFNKINDEKTIEEQAATPIVTGKVDVSGIFNQAARKNEIDFNKRFKDTAGKLGLDHNVLVKDPKAVGAFKQFFTQLDSHKNAQQNDAVNQAKVLQTQLAQLQAQIKNQQNAKTTTATNVATQAGVGKNPGEVKTIQDIINNISKNVPDHELG